MASDRRALYVGAYFVGLSARVYSDRVGLIAKACI